MNLSFTFQYGEIKSKLRRCNLINNFYLHSSMERLKDLSRFRAVDRLKHLHSSMERLKVLMVNLLTNDQFDLHSSMERLKV